MQSTKVCAIIVTYNGLEWIEKCIASLSVAKTFIDVIVIDNGSTDGTREFLRNRKLTYLFESEKNLGFGKANNIGLRYGYQNGYDYFLLLNQDAWIEPNTVNVLIDKLESHQDYGVVSPLHSNGQGTELDKLFKTYLDRIDDYNEDVSRNLLKDIYPAPFVNAACWLLKRQTLEQIGVFHPLFEHYSEDDNYIDRLHAGNLKIGIVPAAKIFHDRDTEGVNPIKDDLRRLYKRTLLQELLKLQAELTKEKAYQISKKLENKLARKLPWFKRFSYRSFCRKEFRSILNEVKHFNEKRQAELSIN